VGRARELLVQAIGLYDDLHDHTEAAKVRALLAALAAADDGGMPSLASG
jgi:hypothetical protein